MYDSAYYLISFIAGKVQDKVQGKAGKASPLAWFFVSSYWLLGSFTAAKERVKEDFTFNNPAFVSANAKYPDPDMNA